MSCQKVLSLLMPLILISSLSSQGLFAELTDETWRAFNSSSKLESGFRNLLYDATREEANEDYESIFVLKYKGATELKDNQLRAEPRAFRRLKTRLENLGMRVLTAAGSNRDGEIVVYVVSDVGTLAGELSNPRLNKVDFAAVMAMFDTESFLQEDMAAFYKFELGEAIESSIAVVKAEVEYYEVLADYKQSGFAQKIANILQLTGQSYVVKAIESGMRVEIGIERGRRSGEALGSFWVAIVKNPNVRGEAEDRVVFEVKGHWRSHFRIETAKAGLSEILLRKVPSEGSASLGVQEISIVRKRRSRGSPESEDHFEFRLSEAKLGEMKRELRCRVSVAELQKAEESQRVRSK